MTGLLGVLGGAVLLVIAGVLVCVVISRRTQAQATGEPPSELEDLMIYDRLGLPVLKTYRPEEYVFPLECVRGGHGIRPGAEFYEVPLPGAKHPNAVYVVCIPCHEAPQYQVPIE